MSHKDRLGFGFLLATVLSFVCLIGYILCWLIGWYWLYIPVFLLVFYGIGFVCDKLDWLP